MLREIEDKFNIASTYFPFAALRRVLVMRAISRLPVDDVSVLIVDVPFAFHPTSSTDTMMYITAQHVLRCTFKVTKMIRAPVDSLPATEVATLTASWLI